MEPTITATETNINDIDTKIYVIDSYKYIVTNDTSISEVSIHATDLKLKREWNTIIVKAVTVNKGFTITSSEAFDLIVDGLDNYDVLDHQITVDISDNFQRCPIITFTNNDPKPYLKINFSLEFFEIEIEDIKRLELIIHDKDELIEKLAKVIESAEKLNGDILTDVRSLVKDELEQRLNEFETQLNEFKTQLKVEFNEQFNAEFDKQLNKLKTKSTYPDKGKSFFTKG